MKKLVTALVIVVIVAAFAGTFAYLWKKASARRARTLGFDGKTCIHPGQVAVVKRVFSPSEEEVARAERVGAALEAGAREGRGVATVDGEMVEPLHAAEARRMLARARRSG